MDIISYIEKLADILPIEVFALVGGFIEELIAPLPSPLVMFIAGTLANETNRGSLYLILLPVIGAVGKTLGEMLIYHIVDKSEDLITSRWGKYLGVSQKNIESIGKYFNKTTREGLVILALRAMPLIPSSIVSVACGLIKVRFISYIWASFVGNSIRNFLFMLVGYYGSEYLMQILLSSQASLIGYVLVALIILFYVTRYIVKRNKWEMTKSLQKLTNTMKSASRKK